MSKSLMGALNKKGKSTVSFGCLTAVAGIIYDGTSWAAASSRLDKRRMHHLEVVNTDLQRTGSKGSSAGNPPLQSKTRDPLTGRGNQRGDADTMKSDSGIGTG